MMTWCLKIWWKTSVWPFRLKSSQLADHWGQISRHKKRMFWNPTSIISMPPILPSSTRPIQCSKRSSQSQVFSSRVTTHSPQESQQLTSSELKLSQFRSRCLCQPHQISPQRIRIMKWTTLIPSGQFPKLNQRKRRRKSKKHKNTRPLIQEKLLYKTTTSSQKSHSQWMTTTRTNPWAASRSLSHSQNSWRALRYRDSMR